MTDFAVRSRRFNDTTGALSWRYRSAAEHPDRCVCQNESTPHKHYSDPPYSCARCGSARCARYRPAIFDSQAIDELAEVIWRALRDPMIPQIPWASYPSGEKRYFWQAARAVYAHFGMTPADLPPPSSS